MSEGESAGVWRTSTTESGYVYVYVYEQAAVTFSAICFMREGAMPSCVQHAHYPQGV